MKRSSISIWKRSRSQLDDLPDCPDELSEPQYAELLFGKACAVSLVYKFYLEVIILLISLSFATGSLHPILLFGMLELGPAPNAYLKSTSFAVPYFKHLHYNN